MTSISELIKRGAEEAQRQADEARELERKAALRVKQYQVIQYLEACGFTMTFDEATASVVITIGIFNEGALDRFTPKGVGVEADANRSA